MREKLLLPIQFYTNPSNIIFISSFWMEMLCYDMFFPRTYTCSITPGSQITDESEKFPGLKLTDKCLGS